jgi:hypothetical protein
LVQGRPEPFKELWSHEADVSIMGAFGAYEKRPLLSIRGEWRSIAATLCMLSDWRGDPENLAFRRIPYPRQGNIVVNDV